MENQNGNWFVVLTEPQQEIPTVWRMHELGLELFTPVVRRRVKTGRLGRRGHQVTRVIAKPMFPGYGFIRDTGINIESLCESTRGVRDYLRLRRPGYDFPVAVLLPDAAVRAVFAKQIQEQQAWLKETGGRYGSHFKKGDLVRVDEGSAYTGLVAHIDRIDSKGRIELLFGMIRHTLPADMVIAA